MGADQILQFRPNFTILEYLEYLEYLELGQFCNFAMFVIRDCRNLPIMSAALCAVSCSHHKPIFGEEKCNYHQFSHHCGLVVVIVIFWYHQHLLETTVPPQLYSLSSLLNWIYACLKKTIML